MKTRTFNDHSNFLSIWPAWYTHNLGPVEVYKTYDDYQTQKMAYVIVCKREKNKIKLYELPNKSFVTVIHKGMPLQILNTAFFGYELCDGNFVRQHRLSHGRDKETLAV